jgi:hypothetical protein
MNKALARHSKFNDTDYVYKKTKAVKAYGGRVCVHVVEDEYRKAEPAQVDSSAHYRLAIAPTVRPTGLVVRNAISTLPVGRDFFASGVTRWELTNFIDKSFMRSPSKNYFPVWEALCSSMDATPSAFNFFAVDSMAWDKHVFDEAAADYADFLWLFSSKANFRDRYARQEWALAWLPNVVEEGPNENWVYETEGILQRLENRSAYPDDYEAAVLFAEVKPFREEQRTRLLIALGDYIDEHRFVEEEASLVTLCSAIRKYAMNMHESQFEKYANWLLPTETETLHHETEMELAKGICWRLEFEPHSWPADYPHMTRVLFDLVDSYLTPRLILQKSYANTAMFGFVALYFLEAASSSSRKLVAKIHKKMVNTGLKWFVDMVEDNLDEAVQYVADRDIELAMEVIKSRKG